jgi:predicted DNA-binding transcriptional regulator AlpA
MAAKAERRLLDTHQVHDRTGIPEGTLRNWRSEGQGPPYMKAGRRVRYPEDLLDEWIDQHLVTHQ